MKGFPDLPPIWFAGAWCLNWAIARVLPQLSVHFVGQSILGWVFLIAGLGLIGWAAFWFFNQKTTIEPHHKATTLLIEGPFRFSRNPIYFGLVVILAGAIITRGTWIAGPILVAFAYIINARFIVPEEVGLREVFGDEAERYIAKTHRWIGL